MSIDSTACDFQSQTEVAINDFTFANKIISGKEDKAFGQDATEHAGKVKLYNQISNEFGICKMDAISICKLKYDEEKCIELIEKLIPVADAQELYEVINTFDPMNPE